MKLQRNTIRLAIVGLGIASLVSISAGIYYANKDNIEYRHFDRSQVIEKESEGNSIRYFSNGEITIDKLSMHVGNEVININIEDIIHNSEIDSILINDNISNITFNGGNEQFILARSRDFVMNDFLKFRDKGVQEYKLNGEDTDFKFIVSYAGSHGYAVLMNSSIDTPNNVIEDRMKNILSNAEYTTTSDSTKLTVGGLDDIEVDTLGDSLVYSSFDRVLSIQQSEKLQTDGLIMQEYEPILFIADSTNQFLGIPENNLVSTDIDRLYKNIYFDDNTQFGYRSYAVKDNTDRYIFKIHEQSKLEQIEKILFDELDLTVRE